MKAEFAFTANNIVPAILNCALTLSIQETARKNAPWYVVPADNKWFTRVVVAAAVIDTLTRLNLRYPSVGAGKLKELAGAKAKLLKK